MGRNDNFNRGRGRRVVGSQINEEKRQKQLDWIRNGEKPKQGQDPDQGFPITVYPENKCENCGAAYFLPEHLQLHTDVKHPPKNL